MSVPFIDLPPLGPPSVRTPMRPSLFTTSATSQPRPPPPRQPFGAIPNAHYTLAPICVNTPWQSAHLPVTPGGPMTKIPYTPSPTYNIARNTSTFSRTDSCFSVGSNMATPLSDDGADDLPVSPELEVRLAGLKPPARYPGPLPDTFSRQDPVPGDESENEEDEKKQKGAPSQNPWDYQRRLKKKERRRFTKRELEAIETLWWVEKAPNKYQRQRIGAWLGVKTKHITVWFQNKRQESKKHAKEKQDAEAQKTHERQDLMGSMDKENVPPTPVRPKESLPTPSSRTGRGSYDPGTGKWRPVPASLISSANPPTQAKCDAILAIANGELSRDEFASPQAPPHTLALPRLPRRPVLGRSTSGSLEQIMSERERDRPRAPKRSHGEPILEGEGKYFNDQLLLFMSSSPSSDAADEESVSPVTSERRGSGGSPIPKRRCPNPISTRPRDSFDRVQTEQVLNGPPTSSPPSLSPPTPHYLVRPANYTLFEMTTNGAIATNIRHPTVDQGDRVFSVDNTEAQDVAQLESAPAQPVLEDQDDEMVQAAALLCALGAGSGAAAQ